MLVLNAAARDLVWSFHECFSSHHKLGDVLDFSASLQEVGRAEGVTVLEFFPSTFIHRLVRNKWMNWIE